MADVHIENGKIKHVCPHGAITPDKGAKIIRAEGKYIIPGGIEPHTHL